MNYNEIVDALQVLSVVPLNNTDTNFATILPTAMDYAERRLWRDFAFLFTEIPVTTTLTANSGEVIAPASVIIIHAANVITPVAVTPSAGTRHPLERVSIAFLNMMWPTQNTPSAAGLPTKYALMGRETSSDVRGSIQIRVAPAPDAAYPLEVIGQVRPAALTSDNVMTFFSGNTPDLFIAACMVFISGYQRKWGAQDADSPMGMSWEKQYKTLKDGLDMVSMRQRAQSADWTAKQPSNVANTPYDRVAS